MIAVRLDRQVNSTERQTEIRELQAECEALLAKELSDKLSEDVSSGESDRT